MNDGLSALADFGALGAMLAVVLAVCGYLIRDLVKQRDRALDSLDNLASSVDRLTDSLGATNEMVRTTNTLLSGIQHRSDR